jgi:succinate dehydrogenase hydrophobic anchor subunit
MHFGFTLQDVIYENTITRMQSPVWMGIEIAFLFSVILHGMAGAYAVLTDYDKIAKFKKPIAVVLIAIGVCAMYIGTMTVMSWVP